MNTQTNYIALKPHAIHFARLRDKYRPVYINWLVSRAMYSGEAWNRLMALIYAD